MPGPQPIAVWRASDLVVKNPETMSGLTIEGDVIVKGKLIVERQEGKLQVDRIPEAPKSIMTYEIFPMISGYVFVCHILGPSFYWWVKGKHSKDENDIIFSIMFGPLFSAIGIVLFLSGLAMKAESEGENGR